MKISKKVRFNLSPEEQQCYSKCINCSKFIDSALIFQHTSICVRPRKIDIDAQITQIQNITYQMLKAVKPYTVQSYELIKVIDFTKELQKQILQSIELRKLYDVFEDIDSLLSRKIQNPQVRMFLGQLQECAKIKIEIAENGYIQKREKKFMPNDFQQFDQKQQIDYLKLQSLSTYICSKKVLEMADSNNGNSKQLLQNTQYNQ